MHRANRRDERHVLFGLQEAVIAREAPERQWNRSGTEELFRTYCQERRRIGNTNMSPIKLWPILLLVLATPAHAQGTMQRSTTTTQSQGTAQGGARNPVATQPSNDPFHNPIGQGVPPAVSANSNQNSNRTNTTPAR